MAMSWLQHRRGAWQGPQTGALPLSILSLEPEDKWIDHGADVQLYNRFKLRISGATDVPLDCK